MYTYLKWCEVDKFHCIYDNHVLASHIYRSPKRTKERTTRAWNNLSQYHFCCCVDAVYSPSFDFLQLIEKKNCRYLNWILGSWKLILSIHKMILPFFALTHSIHTKYLYCWKNNTRKFFDSSNDTVTIYSMSILLWLFFTSFFTYLEWINVCNCTCL